MSFLLYSTTLETGTSRSTSREAEGTGPVKPRQPAAPRAGTRVWCQTRPSRRNGSEDVERRTLNLTYLSLDLSMTNGVLDLDHSQVSLAVDLYLKISLEGGGSPSDDQRRISFGDVDNSGKFQNGIVFDFSGNITWPSPGNVQVL